MNGEFGTAREDIRGIFNLILDIKYLRYQHGMLAHSFLEMKIKHILESFSSDNFSPPPPPTLPSPP